jgi:hypothetical protein
VGGRRPGQLGGIQLKLDWAFNKSGKVVKLSNGHLWPTCDITTVNREKLAGEKREEENGISFTKDKTN